MLPKQRHGEKAGQLKYHWVLPEVFLTTQFLCNRPRSPFTSAIFGEGF
jgi:hypothetical protein